MAKFVDFVDTAAYAMNGAMKLGGAGIKGLDGIIRRLGTDTTDGVSPSRPPPPPPPPRHAVRRRRPRITRIYRLTFDDLRVRVGPIAPGFGQPGGGTQYLFPLRADMMEELGLIREVFSDAD